ITSSVLGVALFTRQPREFAGSKLQSLACSSPKIVRRRRGGTFQHILPLPSRTNLGLSEPSDFTGQAIPWSRTRPTGSQRPSPRPPLTVVVGSSIVRDVVVPEARTHCFPGADLRDIDQQVPAVMEKHQNAHKVVICVGTNNINLHKSHQLNDFRGRIDRLKEEWECFSCLLWLHCWLKSYSFSMDLEYTLRKKGAI
uniref:SGNH hydrolase-type esterase domain-containing protein n=1 Tax=Hucho hucho TaxID=62062 RepID=A0A4W5KG39_9TELE